MGDSRVTSCKLPHSGEELSKTTVSKSETDDDIWFSNSANSGLHEYESAQGLPKTIVAERDIYVVP